MLPIRFQRALAALMVVLAGLSAAPATAAGKTPPPIIDMHMHPLGVGFGGGNYAVCMPYPKFEAAENGEAAKKLFLQWHHDPPCSDPVRVPRDDATLLREVMAAMQRRNIHAVLVGGELTDAWADAQPDRFMRGLPNQEFRLTPADVERLRARHREGKLQVLAEVPAQYYGALPDDESLEPLWNLAEELDVPVGIHIGTGPPGAPYGPGLDKYRARLHSPLTLEEVLLRHPKLRVYVMHAGWPMLDGMLAVLYAHPQVHVDTGAIVWGASRKTFYRYLEQLVEAGFEERIMFGSDMFATPPTLEHSIRVIEEAPFLSAAQKRAILYDNAARFLKLDAATIARQNGRAP